MRAASILLGLVLLAGCSSDPVTTCEPVTCELFCEHGFARGADGCETCSCNPPPDDSCTADTDCVLATDVTGCCGCTTGYPRARVSTEPCLVERGETGPDGCNPDPERCATVDCAACEPALRAVCEAGACTSSSECAAGQAPFRLTCVDACASHDDCTVGADYGSCCGGCSAAPVSFVDGDPCFAERQSDSTCAPAAGACDGLGCASPPTDCVMFGGDAVCMEDGTCQMGGAGGACPPGTMDVGGVCVSS